MITKQELDRLCKKNGFALPDEVLDNLGAYLATLMKWNKVINLVGAQTWKQITEDLVMDSFHLADFLKSLPLPQQPVCWDLGAGAGMPGVPLRMVWTDGEYTMVEAREKRALFLQTVLSACKLPHTRVIRGRAEDFMARSAVKGQVLVSRAFMPWRKVLEFISGKLSAQGLAVCLTLEPVPLDVPQGWTLTHSREYLPNPDNPEKKRYLWAFGQAAD